MADECLGKIMMLTVEQFGAILNLKLIPVLVLYWYCTGPFSKQLLKRNWTEDQTTLVEIKCFITKYAFKQFLWLQYVYFKYCRLTKTTATASVYKSLHYIAWHLCAGWSKFKLFWMSLRSLLVQQQFTHSHRCTHSEWPSCAQ